MTNFQQDIEEIEEEILKLENIIKNPQLISLNEDDNENDLVEERDKNNELKRRNAKAREWDKPKLSCFNIIIFLIHFKFNLLSIIYYFRG